MRSPKHKEIHSHEDKSSKHKKRKDYTEKRRRNSSEKRRRDSSDKQEHEPIDNKQHAGPGEAIVKELPCFTPSGILLQYYNSRQGVSLKFNEPPEGRKPTEGWRLYIFKGEEILNPIILSNSSYLIGKDSRICDILCDNETISRQHAVIQFRQIQKMTVQGDYQEYIRPYIIDLQSTNGTHLNDQQIEHSRYIQLLHRDVLKFGKSSREYVIVKDQEEREELKQENHQQE